MLALAGPLSKEIATMQTSSTTSPYPSNTRIHDFFSLHKANFSIACIAHIRKLLAINGKFNGSVFSSILKTHDESGCMIYI